LRAPVRISSASADAESWNGSASSARTSACVSAADRKRSRCCSGIMPGEAAGFLPSNSCHFRARLSMLRRVARWRFTVAPHRPSASIFRRSAATSSWFT
jgi:hypothetical protein